MAIVPGALIREIVRKKNSFLVKEFGTAKLESIPLMVQRVIASNPAPQLEATTQFRNLLSIDGPNDEIQAFIEAGVCPMLIQLLNYPSPTILIPTVRIASNIITGDDAQTQPHIQLGTSCTIWNANKDDVADAKFVEAPEHKDVSLGYL